MYSSVVREKTSNAVTIFVFLTDREQVLLQAFFLFFFLLFFSITASCPDGYSSVLVHGVVGELKVARLKCSPLLPSEMEWIRSCSSRRRCSNSSLVEAVVSLVVRHLGQRTGSQNYGEVSQVTFCSSTSSGSDQCPLQCRRLFGCWGYENPIFLRLRMFLQRWLLYQCTCKSPQSGALLVNSSFVYSCVNSVGCCFFCFVLFCFALLGFFFFFLFLLGVCVLGL